MHLTRNTYIWWRVNDYDYQCSICDSTVIMNGYLIERADRDPRELGYRFSAQGSRAALYVTSADGQKVRFAGCELLEILYHICFT